MNKAFVREPDIDARVTCPRCGTLGTEVGSGPLDRYINPNVRGRLADSAWFCSNIACTVVYFNVFDQVVAVGELRVAVYPYDVDAPLCRCFGLTWDDVALDAQDAAPGRIRELVEKSKTADAQCQSLAIDGQCCLKEVQRLYWKLKSSS